MLSIWTNQKLCPLVKSYGSKTILPGQHVPLFSTPNTVFFLLPLHLSQRILVLCLYWLQNVHSQIPQLRLLQQYSSHFLPPNQSILYLLHLSQLFQVEPVEIHRQKIKCSKFLLEKFMY